MRRLVPPRAAAAVAGAAFALGAAAGSVAGAQPAAAARSAPLSAHLTSDWLRPAPGGYAPAQPPAVVTTKHAARLPHVILPDLFAVGPRSITAAQLRRLSRLRHVRGVFAVDGGGVQIGGHTVGTIGVSPAAFRSWAPPQTAARPGVWTALARGDLLTTAAVARQLGLHTGSRYRVSGARRLEVRSGGTAAFGIPRVDAVVNSQTSARLGLLPRIGVLISAPKASLAKLDALVRGVLGARSKLVILRSTPQITRQRLPVDRQVPAGRPGNYLELFRASAAQYCPGLSWTVLAAIGQIESGDGQNMGPSPAGALGPMQFMPSTWARWGIDAFGQTGKPDIMNPFDAVPAAAEYLCSYGAGRGGAALSAAIFGYNHASWYVAEVLALAGEYAKEYG